VVELMLRYYKTEPNRIRPEDVMIGHTGYLIFAVKTLPLPEQVPSSEDSGDAEAEAEAEAETGEEATEEKN
jgi:tRNA (adenine57-N1/adenine58-N1)-methyltransferase